MDKQRGASYHHQHHYVPTQDCSLQVQSLQEEILELRAQIALLQSEIACRDHFIEKVSNSEEFDFKQKEEDSKFIIDHCEKVHENEKQTVDEDRQNEMKHLSVLRTTMLGNVTDSTKNFETPVMKVAERVKLKRTANDNITYHLENEVRLILIS